MELPHHQLALVDRAKVQDYLLSSTHRYGAAKARFFQQFGFTIEVWEDLADALQAHGQTHAVVSSEATGFGTRYNVDGELHSPDGRRPLIRTVWHVDTDDIAPRFITAYPLPRGSR